MLFVHHDGWIPLTINLCIKSALSVNWTRFPLSPLLGLVLSTKSGHCHIFIYVGEGLGPNYIHVCLQNGGVCRVGCKNCQGGFSFLSHHLSSKYTFEDLTNEQEMCSRMLDWKEMGFRPCLQGGRVTLASGLTFSLVNTPGRVNPPTRVNFLLFPDPLSVTAH